MPRLSAVGIFVLQGGEDVKHKAKLLGCAVQPKLNEVNSMSNTKVFAIAGGFYIFGTETTGPEGYLTLTNAAMFAGFNASKGVAGLCRGDKAAKVNLDRFPEDEELYFPVSSVYGIFPCIDLYEFEGTTLR